MISGISKRNENQYRELSLDSSSSLKDFATNRKKYYKKYYLNEEVEEEDSKASVTGRVVETLLLDPWEFDNRFYMSACASAPTGLMLSFVEALYKYTKDVTNEEGVVMRDFADISQDAYTESGFKIKYEAVIGKFAGSDAEIYFNEILKVRTNNLTVVTTQDVTNAEKIVEELKTNFVTSHIINLVNSERWEIINQLQVENYTIDNHPMKSMMDKFVADHETKQLFVYDLKTTWSVEKFLSDYFLYRLAYIQMYVYYKATQSLTTNPDSKYYGYKVNIPRFIVCDSTNYYSPLIYIPSEKDIEDAYNGFMYENRHYIGVKDIIEDLKFAQTQNIWNISRKNYELKGRVPLRK